MADPAEGLDLSSLHDAVQFSWGRLQPFREERLMMLRQYLGFHYGENGATDRVPVNMLALLVDILSRFLISRNPQVMISTLRFRPQATSRVDIMHMAQSLAGKILSRAAILPPMAGAVSTR